MCSSRNHTQVSKTQYTADTGLRFEEHPKHAKRNHVHVENMKILSDIWFPHYAHALRIKASGKKLSARKIDRTLKSSRKKL